jgi:hypothetical protein
MFVNDNSEIAAQCIQCPPHTYSQGVDAAECKECPNGKFQETMGSLLCNEVSNKRFVSVNAQSGEREPGDCPLAGIVEEFTCGDGVLRYIREGFWHDGLQQSSHAAFDMVEVPSASTRFYVCPVKSNCRVDEVRGNITCLHNSAGVLCSLCAPGFSAIGASGNCETCPSDLVQVLWPLLVPVAIAAAAVLLWFCCGRARWAVFKRSVLNGHDLGLAVLFKLALGFMQVALLQPSVFDIRFPDLYLGFLDQFAFLSFELPFTSFECLMDARIERFDYHDRVYTIAFVATGIMGALLVGVMQQARSSHNGRLLALCVVPSYVVYPTMSSTLFQTFNCRDIYKDSLHARDLSIDCRSAKHASAEAVAWLMIVVFSIGLPVVYQALLYPHRHALGASAAHKSTLSSVSSLKFLYQDYKPRFYWWEALETVRKLLLTGALVQFQKGSVIQITAAMVIIVFHITLLAYFKPYSKARDGALALFVYAMLLCLFFGSLLISVKGGVPEGSILNHGISSAAVAGLLILTVVSVLVATVSIALADIGGAAGYPVLQHTQSKRPVAFEHYRDPCRFHLFLRLRDTFYCPQANQTNGVLCCCCCCCCCCSVTCGARGKTRSSRSRKSCF